MLDASISYLVGPCRCKGFLASCTIMGFNADFDGDHSLSGIWVHSFTDATICLELSSPAADSSPFPVVEDAVVKSSSTEWDPYEDYPTSASDPTIYGRLLLNLLLSPLLFLCCNYRCLRAILIESCSPKRIADWVSLSSVVKNVDTGT